MPVTQAKKNIVFKILIALIAWFALFLQFYILVKNAPDNELTILQTTSRFFGYFTILTNLLVALSLTIVLLNPASAAGRFFSKFRVTTAIAVYILIVGLGYNILLRHLWKPQGFQFIADELLHDVVPVLYVLFWSFFVPKEKLPWKYLFILLLYPLLYLCYALLRGSLDGWYPYPFIDLKNIGYSDLLKNTAGLLLAFIIVGSLFIFIARKNKRDNPAV